ncbi:hypothetical protein RHMOL_Rhmol12G0050000 [Rhododendron molle]|nr:hypothetical protein RHMOL_Rhmol12G0050000 [Rhododendron molle]
MVLAGFHGRGGLYLDAFGVFIAPKQLNSSQKGKIIAEEGWISLGPWGGSGGVYSTYKSDGPIMQITVSCGDVIDYILFESISRNGVVIGSSVKIGGPGGSNSAKFSIDSSIEHISSIRLTYGDYCGHMVIKEICFYTNLETYGPFGMPSGDSSVYIPIKWGVIVGFYGCGGPFLNAIGIFVAPKVNNLPSIQDSAYARTQLKGKIIGEEGWISLGPWGGGQGVYSTYKPDRPMMQITIRYGTVIDSILFESKSRDGVVIGSSVKIGGPGGASVEKFCIDTSVEQFSSISLTYKDYNNGFGHIKSLLFNTNIKKYGPFGSGGDHSVSIPIEGGVIAGFHGRGNRYVDAIGIFVAPKVKGKIRGEEGWISFGPWGGNDGVDWTYKANGPIMQISICYGEAINSVLFRSRSCDGLVIGSSEEFGATGSRTTKTFFIDNSVEQLSLLRLTYGDYYGQVIITSLYFETNIGKHYGPFGLESGASSVSIPIEGGFIAGFHGRRGTGTYLTSIGIFVAPKVNNLPSSEKKIDSLPSFQDPNYAPTQLEVLGSGVGSKPKTVETRTIKSKWSSRFLAANLKANFCGSKPKTLENIIIANAASSSATTNKDDHRGGALSPSSEMIRKNLDLMDSAFENLNLVDSAFQKYKTHMGEEIREAREKLEELQRFGSRTSDFDKLGKAIAKLKFQIPLATKKDDHYGGALSPTSKMIHSGLILLDTAVAEAEESAHHINAKINQAHEKFKETKILPSSERHSNKLQKADPDKKELQKTIAKLKVQIRSHNKIRSADSNPHQKNWDNINGDEDGMTHFFHKEPEVAHSGDFDGRLKVFHELPEQLRYCLLCFFKFPPMATIKRTSMIYLWIGQGYISEYLHSEGCVGDFEVHAGKIFDELIAKGFIEPIYQNCSLTPDSCKMSLYVRSSLYEEAKRRGFTSDGTLDLDLGFVCGGLDGHSCLINVGEAIISCEPKIFENMKHIRSLYLGRWQSSATHHIELENPKILHGLNKLKSLTFLSLRGISMITELPSFILELNDLVILDLQACHNLEVIPDEIGVLKSLTHLDMSECYFLEHMPESLAQLSNLEVLKGFLIGDFDNNKQSCTLLNLSGLPKLRKLNIYISVKDSVKLNDLTYLESFKSLEKLTISWGGCSLQAQDEETTKAFSVATLPPRLQKLDLQCFPMMSLTNWLMPGKLKELKKLYIRGGQLRDLGEIQKRQAERLTVEILQLKYLSKLELHWRELRTLFPKLIYLHQLECPNLFNFQCDERGMWVDHKAIDTHMQLQKYLRTCGAISTSSMVGSGSTSTQDNCNISPVDEKQL